MHGLTNIDECVKCGAIVFSSCEPLVINEVVVASERMHIIFDHSSSDLLVESFEAQNKENSYKGSWLPYVSAGDIKVAQCLLDHVPWRITTCAEQQRVRQVQAIMANNVGQRLTQDFLC